MKEYSLIAAGFVIVTIILDYISNVHVLRRSQYYIFLIWIFGMKLLVNGFLTSRNIVRYNPRYYLGIRIGSIPLEDFLFGFSMVTMVVISWEYFNKRQLKGRV